MNDSDNVKIQSAARFLKWYLTVFIFILFVSFQYDVHAFTLNVFDQNGIPVSGFRWLLEEDNTHPVTPGAFDATSLSASIHKSYTSVVNRGETGASSASITTDINGVALDATKRYVISVLPFSGYTMGGANVSATGTFTATVYSYPIPTAQISVLVFHDVRAISGIYDIPAESGLANFEIQVYDYLGQVTMDVFGNPLGTTYDQTCDATGQNPGTGTQFCYPPILISTGNGVVTDATGRALVKNLPPGVYTVTATPRDGQQWVQTVSLGGGTKLPVWVKAGEPDFYTQAGVLDTHVVMGFTKAFNNLAPGGTGKIKGQVVNLHTSRPPSAILDWGSPVPNCWVGLNSIAAGQELGLLAQPCNPDSTFSIKNVPAGTYQLIAWDIPLDNLLDVRAVIVPPDPGAVVDMGPMAITRWLGTLEGSVFSDMDKDGFKDSGEMGIMGQVINLRFRDGSIFQSTNTDGMGKYSLPEVVPYQKWLIAEVDYTRLKPTGATIVVDDGGFVPENEGWTMPSKDRRNPQKQFCTQADVDDLIPECPAGSVGQKRINPNTGNKLSKTETGPFPLLLEGMIVHAGQNIKIDWAKTNYKPGKNGGIAGIAFYSSTRAENDPRYAAGETWEPGIPRVPFNLYLDDDGDGIIDDINGVPGVQLADVDNYPFGWIDGTSAIGPEDVVRCGDGTTFCSGDAINMVASDSSDDFSFTGCQGPQQVVGPSLTPIQDCAETLQTWNQVRPAVFDGGYAFTTCFTDSNPAVCAPLSTGVNEIPLPAGIYIVEVVPPPGYDLIKEEDRNVDFGDDFIPFLLPFPCVGDLHTVPAFMSMDGVTPAPYAGQSRPYCDRKQVALNSGQNAAADFHLFTIVPKAGRIVGVVQNPLANTFDPNNPNYGGPQGMAWIPVSVMDFADNVITTVYTDEWGAFNALIPSSHRANVPTPSGFSPNIVTVCSNSPATDPRHDPDFGEICLPVEAFPGKTAYLVSFVNALRGFAGSQTNLDCEFPDVIPQISSVNGPSGGPVGIAGNIITITSKGSVSVPDPDVPGGTILRDYSFGPDAGARSVTIGGIPLTINAWTPDQITATLPAGLTTGQMIVTRDNGNSTPVGVTFHVGAAVVLNVPGTFPTIQAAIDAALTGNLIVVAPGTYNENIIMWKNVILQGSGAGSTVINGSFLNEDAWETTITGLLGMFTPVPNQRLDFNLEEGAGITVLALQTDWVAPGARIDGFTIIGATGANGGGGILVNGYADFLEISNNIIRENQGNLGGGVRLGWPFLLDNPLTPTMFISASNDNINIHHNHILKNGSLNFGGGISIFNGANNYVVTANTICGNYTGTNGGGVAHYGLSNPGLIEKNNLIFNEGFGEGGAVMVMGELIPANFPGGLTPGAGNVTVNANLMQGNLAGDDGGGISLVSANGQDVALSPGNQANWYLSNIVNNIIVNNVAGFQGGAMNIADTVRINLIHNTIAHNDATGTSAVFFGPGVLQTTPMAGGITAKATSANLAAASGQSFSNPVLYNNILWHNNSFYFDGTLNDGLGGLRRNPTSPYWDMQVIGTPTVQNLNPMYNILSYTTDPFTGFNYSSTNLTADPFFVNPYDNIITTAPGANALANFPTIEPLTISGDYHIAYESPLPGESLSNPPLAGISQLLADYDSDVRPAASPDRGADEHVGAAPPPTYSISGKVTRADGSGVKNVEITVRDAQGVAVGIVYTDSNGKYAVNGLANGTYTVTPSKLSKTFNPTSRNVTISDVNATGVKFVKN